MTDKKFNSGDGNSGHCNSGDGNSGDGNSGHCNSGDWNSGNDNPGDYNSGDGNLEDYNSGYYNSGKGNSGDYNSGDYNSGDYNSGDHNSGFFNTNAPTIRMFNVDTGLTLNDIILPSIKLKLVEWVYEEQKNPHPDFLITKSVLITRSYKEAWALYWSEANQNDRDRFLNLPNFDSNIFKEITGIDVNTTTCVGKIVEIDGKKYKLQEV